jgi:hypothetical protein
VVLAFACGVSDKRKRRRNQGVSLACQGHWVKLAGAAHAIRTDTAQTKARQRWHRCRKSGRESAKLRPERHRQIVPPRQRRIGRAFNATAPKHPKAFHLQGTEAQRDKAATEPWRAKLAKTLQARFHLRCLRSLRATNNPPRTRRYGEMALPRRQRHSWPRGRKIAVAPRLRGEPARRRFLKRRGGCDQKITVCRPTWHGTGQVYRLVAMNSIDRQISAEGAENGTRAACGPRSISAFTPLQRRDRPRR